MECKWQVQQIFLLIVQLTAKLLLKCNIDNYFNFLGSGNGKHYLENIDYIK